MMSCKRNNTLRILHGCVKKCLVLARKNRRRLLLCFVALLAVVALCLSLFQQVNRDYTVFLEALGTRESSGQYQAKNQYGYLGKYQLGTPALQDAGFLDDEGNWTELAGRYDIFSEEDFLRSAEGQEAAIRTYHKKVSGYILRYGLDQFLGREYCGVTVTRSGLLAACHLVGVGSMKNALSQNLPAEDANGVLASEYMGMFSGYDISEVWP